MPKPTSVASDLRFPESAGDLHATRHAQDMDMTGADLDHEEHVQAAQCDRAVDVGRSRTTASSWPGCVGTAATACGCVVARAGFAAASAPPVAEAEQLALDPLVAQVGEMLSSTFSVVGAPAHRRRTPRARPSHRRGQDPPDPGRHRPCGSSWPPRRPGSYGALAAQIRLVQEWRRFPFLDPGLPPELLPDHWSGTRAAAVFRARRAAWKPRADVAWEELINSE